MRVRGKAPRVDAGERVLTARRRGIVAALIAGIAATGIIGIAVETGREPPARMPPAPSAAPAKPAGHTTTAPPARLPETATAAKPALPPPAAAKPIAPVVAPGSVTPGSVAPPPQPPSVSLLAVVLTPKKRQAILRLADGSTATFAEGDQVGGWTLKAIAADRVTLTSRRVDDVLSFPADPPRVPPVPAAR